MNPDTAILPMKHIIIAAVTVGAGHIQAARALEAAWKELRPEDQVQVHDLLNFTPPLFRTAYLKSYLKLVTHAPDLWSFFFEKTDNPSLLRKLRRIRSQLARHTYRKFTKLLGEAQPDVVISTHFQPLEILAGLKSKPVQPRPFSACVITDFEAHALWLDPAVDLYCVATEATRARLTAYGFDSRRVAVTGIPIGHQFSLKRSHKAACFGLGLNPDLPGILILAGGFGTGPLAEVLQEIDRCSLPVQALVVCGKNEPLRKKLAAMKCRIPIQVFGFVHNMHELMAASDLVITKPGGLTTSEALALGKPLLIFRPIPGQEAANSDFLLQQGAAMKANRAADLPYCLEQALQPDQLAKMSRQARRLGRPQAAQTICQTVLDQLALNNTLVDKPTARNRPISW
jgi:processive 1,2-diacylglycerol beta-glucosyltransferase